MNQLHPIFQVSEFNQLINTHLGLLETLTVEGEISELNISQNKWVFMTLKDTQATVNVFGVLFQLKNVINLQVGMKVHIDGTPKIHQRSGRFSLHAIQIRPAGKGDLKLMYEKLKQRLTQEGVFDLSHKRTLPLVPEHIGLLTAPKSQALSDFVTIARQRLPHCQITLIPIQVQGEAAVSSILSSLKKAQLIELFDVLVLTRGGGSLEDLAAFNDETVTRAIFASRIPIVCAIGHEDDISLAELAADKRASTPSNAAEVTVPTLESIETRISNLLHRQQNKIQGKIFVFNNRLKTINYKIEKYFSYRIYYIYDLIGQLMKALNRTNQTIDNLKYSVTTNLNKLSQKVDGQVVNNQHRLFQLEHALKYLDVNHVLERGFSITRNDQGQIISSTESLKLKEKIFNQLANGTIISKVITITESHDQKNAN